MDTVDEIKQVLEKAYIEGIHITQDESTIRDGFHPDFKMLVLNDDEMMHVSVDDWLPRLDEMKQANPEMWGGETTYKWQLVDYHKYAAVIKMMVHKKGEYFSTDYMLLYKFSDGWKIVSKVFSI
jgi:hypothetical protein